MTRRSNSVGRWKKSALVALNLYDALILKKYGAFDGSAIQKTAFRDLFKLHESGLAKQEAVNRQSRINGSEYSIKQLSERYFSLCGNKRKRFGMRAGFGFNRLSLSNFMYIRRDGSRAFGFKRLSLPVDRV